MARREVDLGPVDAYAIAIAEGYTGTREQWVRALADAESNSLKAEGYAVGEQNGIPVETGEYFENNAKYYSEQALSEKEDAEAAKSGAEAAKSGAEAAKSGAEAAQTAAETAAARDTAAWLNEHITNPDSPPLDRTLMSSLAAAPADMVGDLKSAFKSYSQYFVGEENPVDELTWTNGYYIYMDGTPISNANSRYSDLIPFDSNKTYTFVWYSDTHPDATISVHGYDANGNWVERIDSFSNGASGESSKVLEPASSSVTQIRLSLRIDIKPLALYNDITISEKVTNLMGALGTVPSGKTAQGQITDNTSDIANLKSAINYAYDEKALFVGAWKIGLINGNTGAEIGFNPAFTNRVSLTTPQEFDYDITVFIQNGYKATIFFIDENDIILSARAVNEGSSYTITAGNIFEILMEKVPAEVVGTHMFDYIQAIKHTMRNYLLYEEIDNAKSKIDAKQVALENLFAGSMYSPGMEYGSTNAGTGAYNANEKSHITTPEWFIPEYPYEIKIKDSEYSCRLLYNDDGVISFENLTTEGNLLFPNRQTKIDLWKTNSIAILDLDTAKNILSLQSASDYLSRRAEYSLAKNVKGYELFSAFVRRGGVSSTTGEYINYVKYRCATPYIVKADRDIKITAITGFRFAIVTFDSSGAFVEDLSWKTTYTIPTGQNFKLLIARTTEDGNEYADVNEFVNALNIESIYATKNGLHDFTLPMLERGFLQSGGKSHLAAHQGYQLNFPGNSVPAFESAGKLGYWGIESDVNQTQDGYLVMIHNTTVDATTDGTGAVNEKTLAQIRELHLNGTEYLIPTFEEYLSVCKRYSCVPVIEIKSTVTAEGIIKLVDTLKTFGMDKTSIIIGSKWTLTSVRAVTDIPYASLYQAGFSPDFNTELNYNKAYQYTGIAWDYALGIDLNMANALHTNGMLFGTFTVDNIADVLSAFAAGVDFVTTNSVLPTD